MKRTHSGRGSPGQIGCHKGHKTNWIPHMLAESLLVLRRSSRCAPKLFFKLSPTQKSNFLNKFTRAAAIKFKNSNNLT